MKKGVITICWEIKEDRIAVGFEMPPETSHLPEIFRRRIVARLCQVLLPGRKEVLPQ